MLNWIKDHNGLCKRCQRPSERVNEKDICLNCAIKVNAEEEKVRMKAFYEKRQK